MKNFLNSHIQLTVHLLIVALIISVSAWYTHETTRSVVELLQNRINTQRALLVTLAEMTDRNEADSATISALGDCERRNDFDSLLGNLGTLRGKELIEVQQLFDACGSYYTERKAIMVARFAREYEVYEEYVSLLLKFDEHAYEEARLNDWSELVSKETERKNLLQEQMKIQERIISLLIGGAYPTSLTVQTESNLAQELQQSLTVVDRQIDVLRADLVK